MSEIILRRDKAREDTGTDVLTEYYVPKSEYDMMAARCAKLEHALRFVRHRDARWLDDPLVSEALSSTGGKA